MENKKIHPLHAAHMNPTKEMLGLTALESVKHLSEPVNSLIYDNGSEEKTLTEIVEEVLNESPKFAPEVLNNPDFHKAIKDNVEKEFPRALTVSQKMKEKHFDRKKQLELNSEIQDRFDASGIIHNEKRNMAIPGTLPPQALLYLNPILPMIIEGKLQDTLWKIQGATFK